MEPNELRKIVEDALRDPQNFPWPIYLVMALLSVVFGYLGSFSRQKGENQAAKQDLAELTRIVESIRTEYAKQIEMLAHENRRLLELGSREHQLRLAALDRRLEAHQEAYTLWRQLAQSVYSPETGAVIAECQAWWNKKCLYLNEEARSAFADAMLAAGGHKDLLSAPCRTQELKEAVQSNWRRVIATGAAIVRGAELPPIGNSIAEGMPQPDEKAG